jgi:hypothetical protein
MWRLRSIFYKSDVSEDGITLSEFEQHFRFLSYQKKQHIYRF